MQTFNPIRSLKIPASKIVHKSPVIHPLARFVTEEAAALLFNISVEEIYKITCLRYVVHVHGKRISRFVSYADFPPIVNVTLPTPLDFYFWHKRWRKKPAQEFWKKFYIYQFERAVCAAQLWEWSNLVAKVKTLFTNSVIETLREVAAKQQSLLNLSLV
ncbi:hypothetical protein ACE1CI_03685 [Aerosakkonemataceae cyanobacterium BLCC-F50]|uniref:LAGLIDADG homing endonuclease n=1 Tax=Floridaenema flaviceps BLCC-F50 TaxID=3153642 RepID=A0ABV4XJZ6_9CYAN